MSDATKKPQSLKAVMDQLNAAESERASAPAQPKLSSAEKRARTVARLAAVQALYQMEISGVGVEAVVREFSDHRFETDLEGEPLAEGDKAYFGDLVRGAVTDQVEVDRAIVKRLATGWRLERLDATLRAVLRAGAWELKARAEVPVEVLVDEYVEIAKAFFDEAEAKFVNAALDGVARDVRG